MADVVDAKLRMPVRVLVVDDDPITLAMVRRTLVHAGHAVSALQGGFGFAVAVRSFDPDVVLLDINMPGLNGLGALRSARELSQLGESRPRVVLHSGEQPAELVRLVGVLHADGYLCKPATREALLAAVDPEATRVAE